MAILGKATSQGTQTYRERYLTRCAADHFREVNGLAVSSIGIGTYLGQPNKPTDAAVTEAVVEAVRGGINLIDTAINYRYMHAEWSIRAALSQLIKDGVVSREELIICSKGGFLPDRDRDAWFSREYVNNPKFSIRSTDLVAGCHCLHPEYLQDQLDRSLENLDVETIDIYYIHNPETQLSEVSQTIFYKRLSLAFEVMEAAVKAGKISAYGLATWSGFRVPPTNANHIDLARTKRLAREAAGSQADSFKVIQLPLNPGMLEAFVKPTQQVESEMVSAIAAANKLGISAIASAAIGQAKGLGTIPESLDSALGDRQLTNAMKTLQFTRSVPGLLAALVGMKAKNHVAENLALTATEPLSQTSWQAIINQTN